MGTRRSVCVLLVAGLHACAESSVEAVPTETELAIFTEIVLIEATLQDFSGPAKDTLAVRYYEQLYDRFGVSPGDLDALRQRYNADVALWQAMADSVEARLQRSQADPSELLRTPTD